MSTRDGDSEIYALARDGRTLQLTRNRAHDYDPVWSPDGKRIAFVSTRDGDPEVYVMDGDGTNVRQLTANRGGRAPAPIDAEPAWSPDGKRIAFTSDRDGGEAELYVMRADGTGQRRVTRTARHVADHGPDWSPDGRTIAFSSDRDGFDDQEIFTVRPDGTGLRQITQTPAGVDDTAPAWSPDGRRLAFTSNRAGTQDIWVMAADGGNQRLVTGSLALDDVFPTWTGDGRQLVFWTFAAPDGGPSADVWAVAIDGTRRRQIVATRSDDTSPDAHPASPLRPDPNATAPRHATPNGETTASVASPIESVRQVSPTELVVTYWAGHPDCNPLQRVAVEESTREVAVTVRVGQPADRTCVQIAVQYETGVKLSSPLGHRRLRDGTTSTGGAR